MKTYVGIKLLREDGGSINDEHGRIIYPIDEEIKVPGYGAYIAIKGGLCAGGVGSILAYFEARCKTGADAPDGVICFKYVKRISSCPERLNPALRKISNIFETKDQALLATISREDADPDVRAAAVRKLEDQALLATISREDADWRVRAAAVRKLEDQAQ